MPSPLLVPDPLRILFALVAFPAGWAVREASSGGPGGVVVLALIGGCALGLPRRDALRVVVLGILCFAAVHLVAAATTVYVGLVVGALAFAALGSRVWRSSSSARPGTPVT